MLAASKWILIDIRSENCIYCIDPVYIDRGARFNKQ